MINPLAKVLEPALEVAPQGVDAYLKTRSALEEIKDRASLRDVERQQQEQTIVENAEAIAQERVKNTARTIVLSVLGSLGVLALMAVIVRLLRGKGN